MRSHSLTRTTKRQLFLLCPNTIRLSLISQAGQSPFIRSSSEGLAYAVSSGTTP